MITASLAISIASLIIALLALGIALFNLIRFEAKEKSQHSIQLVPADSLLPGATTTEELGPQGPTMFEEFNSPLLRKRMEMESLDKKIANL